MGVLLAVKEEGDELRGLFQVSNNFSIFSHSNPKGDTDKIQASRQTTKKSDMCDKLLRFQTEACEETLMEASV